MTKSPVGNLLRSLYRELKPTVPMGKKYVFQTESWQRIMSAAQEGKTSSEKEAKLVKLGQKYLDYLQSIRKYSEIVEKYKGLGERNPKDLAHILGFKMPDEPKVSGGVRKSATKSAV